MDVLTLFVFISLSFSLRVMLFFTMVTVKQRLCVHTQRPTPPPFFFSFLVCLCCHGYYRRLPNEEDGSMSSHGSGKLNTGKSSSARRTTMSNSSKSGKEELHKKSSTGEGEHNMDEDKYESTKGLIGNTSALHGEH